MNQRVVAVVNVPYRRNTCFGCIYLIGDGGGFCDVLFRFVRETVAESNMGGGGIAKVE